MQFCGMTMKELPAGERPREKMLTRGPEALSDGELLAVLLRTGNRGETALDLARKILAAGGGTLTGLYSMSAQRLSSLKGMGPLKGASVTAALELGRRFFAEGSPFPHTPMLTARMVYDYMIPTMKGLDHEEFWIIYLNDKNYPLHRQMLTRGGGSSTVIDPRQVTRNALEKNASGIIMVHNHPSGNPNPSQMDIKATDRLRRAVEAFSIDLADHVIVCDNSFFSFMQDRMVVI